MDYARAREMGDPPPRPDGLEPNAKVRTRGRPDRAQTVPAGHAETQEPGHAETQEPGDAETQERAHRPSPAHAPAASTRSVNSRSSSPWS